jgi:hypothetical protein
MSTFLMFVESTLRWLGVHYTPLTYIRQSAGMCSMNRPSRTTPIRDELAVGGFFRLYQAGGQVRDAPDLLDIKGIMRAGS